MALMFEATNQSRVGLGQGSLLSSGGKGSEPSLVVTRTWWNGSLQ